jgi:hypothetical protein
MGVGGEAAPPPAGVGKQRRDEGTVQQHVFGRPALGRP